MSDSPGGQESTCVSEREEGDLWRRALGLGSGVAVSAPRLPDGGLSWQRWLSWLRFAGNNDGPAMRRLLRSWDLKPSAVREWTGPVETPAWSRTFSRILDFQPDPRWVVGAEEVPFVQLLLPWLGVARELRSQSLRSQGLSEEQLASASARSSLDRAILSRLSKVAAPALLEEFSQFRRPSPGSLFFGTQARGPNTEYQRFVELFRARPFFAKYPALARALTLLVEMLAEAQAEFLSRLWADRESLSGHFCQQRPCLPLIEVQAGLSDAHGGSRSVFKVALADGTLLAYKPRPLDMEAGLWAFVEWLSGQGLAYSQRAPAVLSRQNYGWMEWVESTACQNHHKVQAFFWRVGGLMAINQLLCGSDMHFENLVACADFPMLIDSECLLQPAHSQRVLPSVMQDALPEGALPGANLEWMPDLLISCFLPLYSWVDGGTVPVNTGALGPPAAERGVELFGYEHVNRDWMRAARVCAPFKADHLARDPNGRLNVADHVEQVCRGWRETWQHFLNRREWLLHSKDSPLAWFEKARGRFLARTTPVFARLLELACTPQAMISGIDFELCFEPLRRNTLRGDGVMGRLLPAELADLRRLDIPRFGLCGNSRMAFDSQARPVAEVFSQTPYEALQSKLRSRTAQDVETDLQRIGIALSRPYTGRAGPPEQILRDIADFVLRHGLNSGWMGLTHERASTYCAELGPGLYSGNSGVALFMLAAGRVLEDERLLTVGRESLRALHARLTSPAGGFLRKALGTGYGSGLGGVFTAFACGARILGRPGLAELALDLVEHLSEAIQSDRIHDLLGGNAGLIAGLLALHQVCPRPQLLDLAVEAGAHLLEAGRVQNGLLSWPFRQGPGLTGFSHGASGPAYAFSLLFLETGQSRWRESALQAVAYERTLYDPQQLNWPDLRDPGQLRFCASWCHGAPGIALARVALLQALAADHEQRPALTSELEWATRTSLENLDQQLDDLCCGLTGLVEILRIVGACTGVASLAQAAEEAFQACIQRAAGPQGAGLWTTQLPVLCGDIGLFKGLSGVGYGLARTLRPHLVPQLVAAGLSEARTNAAAQSGDKS